jgi:hypothetical protein
VFAVARTCWTDHGCGEEFIAALPSIETLMPFLCLAEIAGEAEPPIAEQLVSSNALRSFQVWRYRLIKVRHRIPTRFGAPSRDCGALVEQRGGGGLLLGIKNLRLTGSALIGLHDS